VQGAKFEDKYGNILTLAQIVATATENSSTLESLVTAIGKNGNVLKASILQSVKEDEALIKLIADKVTIEGSAEFVTRDDLANKNGSTVISGNNIEIWMDDDEDESESKIMFGYGVEYSDGKPASFQKELGALGIKYYSNRRSYGSRHMVELSTGVLYDGYDATGIGLHSVGMTLLDGGNGVWIRGNRTISKIADVEDLDEIGAGAYIFASDGIYYTYEGEDNFIHTYPVYEPPSELGTGGSSGGNDDDDNIIVT